MLTTSKTIYDKPSRLLLAKNSEAHNFTLDFKNDFQLESGEQLTNLQLAYTTYGNLNEDKSNVIWICHALTANSEPHDWWGGLVGSNKLFDPNKHFIVCANLLGSPYGTRFDYKSNEGADFNITIRDNINMFIALRKHLKIDKIHTLIGGSLGGHQALEWAIIEPNSVQNLILCATSAKLSPWAIAFNETQRLAINASALDGSDGLKVARAIALLSYRNAALYNKTQNDSFKFGKQRLVESYQAYQGEKFAERFNSGSYICLTKTMDSHDVGRDRGGVDVALRRIEAKTLVIGLNSDILFSQSESKEITENIPDATLVYLNSEYGHDGFLIECKALESSIKNFYQAGLLEKTIKNQKSGITLFGLGCVGEGFYELLKQSNIDYPIPKVVVKNSRKIRNINVDSIDYSKWKPKSELSKLVIELINNNDEAYDIAIKALSTGRCLVSASKKMIAQNLAELISLQENNKAIFLYEAAVAASIPILRLLNDYHDVRTVSSIKGILNGSSNFILSEMSINETSYQKALGIAIKKGFAELDPSSDVGGYDAKYKTVILAMHGFGLLIKPEQVINLGIENITLADIDFAKKHQWEVKPIASIIKHANDIVSAYVLPEFTEANDALSNIQFEENAIKLKDKNEEFLYSGKGAGKNATGMAVFADTKAVACGYRYHYKTNKELKLGYSEIIKLYVRNEKGVSWSLWDGENVLAEFDDIKIIETRLEFIKDTIDEIRNGFFIAKLPNGAVNLTSAD